MYKKKIRQWSLYKGSKDNEAVLLERERRKVKLKKQTKAANRISKPTSKPISVLAPREKSARPTAGRTEDSTSPSDSNHSSTDGSSPSSYASASVGSRFHTPTPHGSSLQVDQSSPYEDSKFVQLLPSSPPDYKWVEPGRITSISRRPYPPSPSDWSPDVERQYRTEVISFARNGLVRSPAYPTTFRIPEEMFSSMRSFVISRLEPRFSNVSIIQTVFGPKIRRQRLSTPHCIINFDVAMSSGFQAMAEGKVATYGAFFEKAFRCVQDIILSNHYCTILAVMTFLCEAERRHMQDLGKMLLRYVCGISFRLLGRDHPHSVWSRDLLAIFEQPRVLAMIVESLCDAIRDTLGADDDYNLIMRLSALDVLQHYHTEETAIQKYEEVLQDCMVSPFDNEFPFQATQTSFAEYLKQHGHYSRAESVLALIPATIDKSGSPIVNRRLLQSLIALAQSQGAQGKDEQAEQTWTSARTKSTELFGPDDSDTIAILQNYAAFLKSRGRDGEAAALEDDIDRRMEPFMLRAEGTPDVSSPTAAPENPDAERTS